MIRFERPKKPNGFTQQCEKAGATWLRDHPGAKRPKDLWTPFKPQLAEGFRQLCAFSVLYEPVGTVDHFLSWKHQPHLAYQWSNYRFVSGWLNSCKQTADGAVLDPFEVGDGWFEILLPSLQLVLTDQVPADRRRVAEFTLRRLHLRDDERVLRQRREWYRMYLAGEITLEGLRTKAPLIARAVEKAAP